MVQFSRCFTIFYNGWVSHSNIPCKARRLCALADSKLVSYDEENIFAKIIESLQALWFREVLVAKTQENLQLEIIYANAPKITSTI